MKHSRSFLFLTLLLAWMPGHGETNVQYLANAGVMITHNDTKVLIDPVYNNGFNRYQLVPDDIREAMFAGDKPYDGVDAILVSHHHGDHFSAADMLRLMHAQQDAQLYAPTQAVAAMRELAGPEDGALFDRTVGIELEHGDSPVQFGTDAVLVEAAFIPHSGWPTRMTEIQNLSYRVTLNNDSTVLHMGDADARTVHFSSDEEFWEERIIDLAMPPYWFFTAADGPDIIEDRITIINSIGVHVPDEFANPANIPDDLRGYELFLRPGEGRKFKGTQ